jgi:hypothetical protein
MNIIIGRYPRPTDEERAETEERSPGCTFPSDTWDSYIEPEDRSWLLFVEKDGTPLFWPHREPSGAVIGEAVTR